MHTRDLENQGIRPSLNDTKVAKLVAKVRHAFVFLKKIILLNI